MGDEQKYAGHLAVMTGVIVFLAAWLETDPSVAKQDRMIDKLIERYGKLGLRCWHAAVAQVQAQEAA